MCYERLGQTRPQNLQCTSYLSFRNALMNSVDHQRTKSSIPSWYQTLTRLRLGFNHLREHKFRQFWKHFNSTMFLQYRTWNSNVFFFSAMPVLQLKAATGGVLQEKMFLEISQNSQKNTCVRVSYLIKLQASACKSSKSPFQIPGISGSLNLAIVT